MINLNKGNYWTKKIEPHAVQTIFTVISRPERKHFFILIISSWHVHRASSYIPQFILSKIFFLSKILVKCTFMLTF